MKIKRCPWATKSKLLRKYHDTEWCVPTRNEDELFATLSLEIFQAGLQWELILRRRSSIERAFNGFKINRVAKFNLTDFQRLIHDKSIIRNRAKISAIIHNAKIINNLHQRGITLKQLTWQPVHGIPIDHMLKFHENLDYSLFIRIFKKNFDQYRFERIGIKTLYSYLQAAGVVNDHLMICFRYAQLS